MALEYRVFSTVSIDPQAQVVVVCSRQIDETKSLKERERMRGRAEYIDMCSMQTIHSKVFFFYFYFFFFVLFFQKFLLLLSLTGQLLTMGTPRHPSTHPTR